jgi:NCS1 family nucleobase:cation symporter-1
MGLYSFIGVAVTSAAYVIYADLPPEQKKALWDPVNLLAMFENKLVLVVAMIALSIATLATNIAANVVSPANDFAHLWPRRITFRIGGLITGLIGILIQPWRLLANAGVYIYTWLVGYSLLLGAVGGVLVADYIVLRRTRLDQAGLYLKDGPYWYLNGFNPRALVALALGIGVSLPGFLVAVGALAVVGDPDSSPGRAIVPTFLADVYPYAWFASFGVSFVVYLVLMAMRRRK